VFSNIFVTRNPGVNLSCQGESTSLYLTSGFLPGIETGVKGNSVSWKSVWGTKYYIVRFSSNIIGFYSQGPQSVIEQLGRTLFPSGQICLLHRDLRCDRCAVVQINIFTIGVKSVLALTWLSQLDLTEGNNAKLVTYRVCIVFIVFCVWITGPWFVAIRCDRDRRQQPKSVFVQKSICC
jgi:hypothetical protein